ncbi:c-type cytochrome [Salinarimonas rosea]|uniref:c-type cytochrome n=1 Tax=Salinarimonas rosea TaxID=552063 RepID=UPI00041D8DEC|nr:cytochrome c [Salinarimonas rosea]
MRRTTTIVAAVALAAAAAGATAWWLADDGDAAAQAARVTQGRAVYAAYCASCHGANLEGQANWMERLPSGRLPAPPHDETGHTWHHSDRQLVAIIEHGPGVLVPGYESDMPGFAGVLTDEEIDAVLAFIKSTWPERERTVQAERSRADPG